MRKKDWIWSMNVQSMVQHLDVNRPLAQALYVRVLAALSVVVVLNTKSLQLKVTTPLHVDCRLLLINVKKTVSLKHSVRAIRS